MPAALTVPIILTKSDWDKKKGIFAKIAGRTGIGEAMQAVNAAYVQIDWTKFDAKMAAPGAKLVSVVNAAEQAAKVEMSKVQALQKKVVELRDLATTTHTNFGKKKMIPPSSVTHVDNVKKAAETFRMTLQPNSSYFSDADKTYFELRKKLEDQRLIGFSKIKEYISKIKDYANELKTTPNTAAYIGKGTTGFHQAVRGLEAALATQTDPQLADYHKVFKPFSQDAFKPKLDSEVKPKMVQVISSLQTLSGLMK